jgi:coniferyl-aldehyde dehydrogenase
MPATRYEDIMNDSFEAEYLLPHVNKRMCRIFEAQQLAFTQNPFPGANERRSALNAMKRQIGRYQDVLAAAMSSDFGFRSPAESKMLELLGTTLEMNHAISDLRRWMRPSRRVTELLFFTNSVKVIYPNAP